MLIDPESASFEGLRSLPVLTRTSYLGRYLPRHLGQVPMSTKSSFGMEGIAKELSGFGRYLGSVEFMPTGFPIHT